MVTARLASESRPLVLIVDDDVDELEMLQRHLVSQYEIIGAGDGLEGYALAVVHQPAAIVMDITMPIVDGWTVMRKLHSNPVTRHIPILIATALDREGVTHEATRLGVKAVLRKPVVLAELRLHLEQLAS